MSKAVIARKAGDEYQDNWFWLQAARMLREGTPIAAVGYEVEGVVGFDDVVVFYEKPILDEFGDPVTADYFQVKFHIDYSGTFASHSLTDPKFIHCSATSLLQRVLLAQQALAPDGKGVRLSIVSPWPIDSNDPLSKLVSTQNGEIRLEPLFKGGPRSAMGAVRKLWVTHLDLKDEEELKRALRPLRIHPQRASQADLRERVNLALTAVGFAPMGSDRSSNPYHAIIRSLHREGRTKFSRTELTDACKAAGLFVGTPIADPGVTRLGIRSFLRWAEHLEDETDHLLDLLPVFDARMIRSQELWGSEVLPTIKRFLEKHVRSGHHYHMFLDTHSSVAFAAGYVLGMKSGAHIVLMQTGAHGRVAWDQQVCSSQAANTGWSFDKIAMGQGDEVALAVSVTHDILHDVKLFIGRHLPEVGCILHARITGGPSSSTVQDGSHAFALTQQLISRARQEQTTQFDGSPLHLFFAAPNAFVFLVGRHSRVLGRCVMYEYDFDTNRRGAYRQSIKLPTC